MYIFQCLTRKQLWFSPLRSLNYVDFEHYKMGNEQTKEDSHDTSLFQNANLKPMQGKFRNGVQYNMKIIIRGDIRTGKSTLFNRLQGYPFKEEYIPTPQIQVANIQWKYNQTSDVIKVEIWDVVDKGINPISISRKPDTTGLKIDNNQGPVTPTSPVRSATESSPDQLTLDAETINVYRNTHGVILLFDITKNWTFDYAIKELKKIPEHMAILLLGNFGDLSSQRVITKSQIYQSIAECNRLRVTEYPPANMIRYVETSMLTGFGLEYIHKYLGIPFLQLQKDILRQQLELKTKELGTLLDTLDNSEEISSSARKQHSVSNDIPEPKQIEQDRLEQEKSALKNLWNKEFQDLSQQKESGDDVKSVSPTTLNLDQHTSTSLLSKRSKAATPDIAMIDEFDAGELEEDFFDDTPDPSSVIPALPPKVEEQDDPDLSNPMVTADEDLVGNVMNDIEDDVDNNKSNIRQSIKFNSDLTDVWKLRQSNTASTSRISNDSSDDDLVTGAKQMNLLDRRPSNAASFIEKSRLSQALREENNSDMSKYSENILSMISNPYLVSDNVIVSNSPQEHNNFIDSSFDVGSYTPMTFGTPSAYEEIGEGQDNPWLEKDSKQQSTIIQSHKDYEPENSSSNYQHQKLHLHHPKSFDESSPWGGFNNDESKSNIKNSQSTEESLLDAYIKSKEQSTIGTMDKSETIPKKKKKKKTSDSNNKKENNDETKREKSKKKKSKNGEGGIGDDRVATKEKKKSSIKKEK
ncbi:hypothetical protein C1645_835870 [Glomus cerebriforme]|uniref:P-loop containing nucleoside triphosphate hydrolase protein n=1 Tax=Glomus cerebriforme TaxID=658196 RepID=A0A397S6X0_9GLOM|nr:hypothetical protein C1645_835870 [Glomus cerebriforme]